MIALETIPCPKCKNDVKLSEAKPQGISCPSCFFWIPRVMMVGIINKEMELQKQKKKVAFAKQNIVCPHCQNMISYNEASDGGVMCYKCYQWVPVSEEKNRRKRRDKSGDQIDLFREDTPHRKDTPQKTVSKKNIPAVTIHETPQEETKEAEKLPWDSPLEDDTSDFYNDPERPKTKISDPFKEDRKKMKNELDTLFYRSVTPEERDAEIDRGVSKTFSAGEKLPPSPFGDPVKLSGSFRPIKSRKKAEETPSDWEKMRKKKK